MVTGALPDVNDAHLPTHNLCGKQDANPASEDELSHHGVNAKSVNQMSEEKAVGKSSSSSEVDDAQMSEKARIQSLINNLVARVAAGEGEVPPQSSSSVESTNKSDTRKASEKTAESSKLAGALAAVRAAEARVADSVSRASPAEASSPTGVRLDDHRAFRIRDGPVCWSQSADSITLSISVPGWVRKEHVVVRFQRGALAVRVDFAPNTEPVFELVQPLFGGIDEESSMWMLEGAGATRKLTLELEKGRIRWWSRLFMGDDPKDYIPLERAAHKDISPPTPGSPLSPEVDSPPTPPPPAVEDVDGEVPPPPDHPPPQDALPPTPAENNVDENENNDNVNDAVREIVDEVVESVVTEVPPRRAVRRVVFSEPEGVRRVANNMAGPSRRNASKVLTIADVKRMLQKNLAEVEANGPSAAQAALQIGMVYCHGPYGIERDAKLAAQYLEYGLENGALDANAAFQLGMMYNSGDGIDTDPARAVRWWRVAAQLGNAVAMFNLGVMKMNGSGCEMDPIEALRLFTQAHAANPRLKPPALTSEQIAERLATAERLRKERAKLSMTTEEREARRQAAIDDMKMVAYGTGAVAVMTVGAILFRNWWRNRL